MFFLFSVLIWPKLVHHFRTRNFDCPFLDLWQFSLLAPYLSTISFRCVLRITVIYMKRNKAVQEKLFSNRKKMVRVTNRFYILALAEKFIQQKYSFFVM